MLVLALVRVSSGRRRRDARACRRAPLRRVARHDAAASR
ncbi:hypothetical protein BURPS406E_G0725 [Burkholderia pseudomallei 406e]|uniref:Uncharacterized protein n=2 Tax=Burkholderia pseudomallei TaxID=28450 RepID=A0A0E1VTG4_BURPE|nr:hypothetical protein BURPS1106A_A1579 [Burkholderia pseudomallei 1106a]EDO87340.1 hypothetical protein BURPS406E_G0725 [Burkholderia pseudomallei 406e]EDO93622.1 hypothetical protein BURPSPAST_J0917 [Burkholderia pseudomallei Pasteur 52237]EEH23809.1 hypothetical protein BUH_5903 [Burkholderia pseudomallei Pakistan 9]EEP50137.1 hypothetical protein GBP346_B0908 [Burkholderia pseudomallei MSHR346]EES23695.1 hypothetical protein BURPS1106B_0411 [Burkholderia pseudomallei 1106b]EET04225.1 hyp